MSHILDYCNDSVDEADDEGGETDLGIELIRNW